jgi:hypothetical protein
VYPRRTSMGRDATFTWRWTHKKSIREMPRDINAS